MRKSALIAAASLAALPLALAVLVASLGDSGAVCDTGLGGVGASGWVTTAYGPPWDHGNGSGITATGVNLTGAPHLFEIAVDPAVIALGSLVYIEPNPFDTNQAFLAADTGSAILGRHVDIYDWRGRAYQDAWGTRSVTVTLAPPSGAAHLLDTVPPTNTDQAVRCAADTPSLTSAQSAVIEPDGTALAPADAPATVKLAIAAGNLIHTLPYPTPDVHYGTLQALWPAYDCSGATSFVLYEAGLLGPDALTSTGLETYGLPGPGRWISVYANSAHAWIVVAGIALDTAGYGGPPIPAGSGPRWRPDATANLQDGTPYVARHPPGL